MNISNTSISMTQLRLFPRGWKNKYDNMHIYGQNAIILRRLNQSFKVHLHKRLDEYEIARQNDDNPR
jgi:hypothetical protein